MTVTAAIDQKPPARSRRSTSRGTKAVTMARLQITTNMPENQIGQYRSLRMAKRTMKASSAKSINATRICATGKSNVE